MAEAMRANVAALLKGIDRYNPENLPTLERYVEMQCQENVYDLEANLAVLKLYQFNPSFYQQGVAGQILLKALTNLPHSDFTLCKCLMDSMNLEEKPILKIIDLANRLECCDFRDFWALMADEPELVHGITGFQDSIRKFICHVVSITYQSLHMEVLAELLGSIEVPDARVWITKYGWREQSDGWVFIGNQTASVKTKNITEKITFESVAGIMAASNVNSFR